MNSKERISAIKQLPLNWKELDIVTAAERYMDGMIELPLVTFILPCFPNIEEITVQQIHRIWQFSTAIMHLHQKSTTQENPSTQQLMHHACRIYEQENQRILTTMFPPDHTFWKPFYKRQSAAHTKPLIVIDALHYYTNCQHQIAHQLLIQCLKMVLLAENESGHSKSKYYENANRLLMDLPLKDLKCWLVSRKEA